MSRCFADVPSMPRNISVTSVSERSIAIRWDEPESDGGCDITSYTVEMREASKRTWQRAGTVDAGEGNRVFEAVALTEGQQYVFRVAAENQCGVGEWAEMTQSVTAKSAHGNDNISFLVEFPRADNRSNGCWSLEQIHILRPSSDRNSFQ